MGTPKPRKAKRCYTKPAGQFGNAFAVAVSYLAKLNDYIDAGVVNWDGVAIHEGSELLNDIAHHLEAAYKALPKVREL